jgi:YcxB-like protein
MPRFGLSLENKRRFILSTGVAFGIVASAGWFALMRINGRGIPWPMVPFALGIWLSGGMVWAWIMHAYMQRYRLKTQAFYSRLKEEMATAHVSQTGDEEREHIGNPQRISVVLSGYTYWENIKLAILTIYSSPLRSLSSGAFVLMMSILVLLNLHGDALWPFASAAEVVGRLFELGVIFMAMSFLFGALVAFAQQAAQTRIFKRLGPTTLTFSAEGVVIKPEAASSSALPWSSINRAREVAGFVLLIRGGRFIVGLPKRLLSPTDLEGLRRLLSGQR